jgi:ABC-type lipoprotein export system ATPase subunit
LLTLLDLVEFADRAVTEISMGQQQRVAVARAMAVTPDLLMADEPTSFQDDDHAAIVVDALRQAADLGSGVLVATHDPAVTAAADRIVEVIAI